MYDYLELNYMKIKSTNRFVLFSVIRVENLLKLYCQLNSLNDLFRHQTVNSSLFQNKLKEIDPFKNSNVKNPSRFHKGFMNVMIEHGYFHEIKKNILRSARANLTFNNQSKYYFLGLNLTKTKSTVFFKR